MRQLSSLRAPFIGSTSILGLSRSEATRACYNYLSVLYYSCKLYAGLNTKSSRCSTGHSAVRMKRHVQRMLRSIPRMDLRFAPKTLISALPPQCRATGADLCTGVDSAAANQPDLWRRLTLASAWLVLDAHVPGKTAPTNFKRALVLGQFAQPSPSLSHSATPRKNMNLLPHVRFTEPQIWTSMI